MNDILPFTEIEAIIAADGTGSVGINGVSQPVLGSDEQRVRAEILGLVMATANETGRPVRLITRDPSGEQHLDVYPDEEGEDAAAQLAAWSHARTSSSAPTTGAPLASTADPDDTLMTPISAAYAAYVTDETSAGRESSLADEAPVTDEAPGADRSWGASGSWSPAEPSGSAEAGADSPAAEEPSEDQTFAVETSAVEPSAEETSPGDHSAEEPSPLEHSAEEPSAAEPSGVWPLAAEETPLPDEPSMADESPVTGDPSADHGATTEEASAGELSTEQAETRASFLVEDTRPAPATKGWRGFVAKTGIRIRPSRSEMAERADIFAVSQHWAGPRTIAIVNGKGGANKTPTTAMLAALFARNGGAGVLAWDNNETRGTLGWRTEQGPHAAFVQSLLPNTDHLLSAEGQSSDLAHFVHHQAADKYDVLRSKPTMLAAQQRLTAEDFDALHAVATKYFRLIFLDSGNDESAERWLRMIDHTDQLVIATTALGEHAEAGALLLEALSERDARSAELARNAVVIVSQSEKTGGLSSAQAIVEGFQPLARRALSIPFDVSMHGGKLRYDSLAPATRRAWLAAAAAVAEGL